MAPRRTSSMLGWVAAVTETEAPSQPSPVVIQTTWTSDTAEGTCVDLPYGTAAVAMPPPPRCARLVRQRPRRPDDPWKIGPPSPTRGCQDGMQRGSPEPARMCTSHLVTVNTWVLQVAPSVGADGRYSVGADCRYPVGAQ